MNDAPCKNEGMKDGDSLDVDEATVRVDLSQNWSFAAASGASLMGACFMNLLH